MNQQLPSQEKLYELLVAAIDGIDGYECERGDLHPYWLPEKINEARIVIDSVKGRPPSWRERPASLSDTSAQK